MTDRGRRRRVVLAALSVLAVVLAVAGFVAWRSGLPTLPPPGPVATYAPDHAAWDAILARRVSEGRVDYAALAASDLPALDAYLRGLGAVPAATLAAAPNDEQFAFWINAYNAFTVRLIAARWPVQSIQALAPVPHAVFARRFISLPGQGAQLYSLNRLEHDILRPRFGDARVHFAIVCASRGCPPLQARAFRADRLDAQLDAAVAATLGDPARTVWRPSDRTLALSAVFEWFANDFVREQGSVVAWVAAHSTPERAAELHAAPVALSTLPWDWSLNGL